MKKTLLTMLFAFAAMVTSNAQDKLWKVISPERLSALEKFERATIPSDYKLFNLNFNELKTELATAPLDSEGIISNTLISFPNSKGEMELYRIYEAPVMEKGLSDKFPGIKSYIGQGIDDKTASIRFSVTLFGLHVMSTSGTDGTFYIDTYTKDLNNYIVYNRRNISTSRTFSCLVEDDHEEITQQKISTYAQKASDGLFRQYRMAMACTIEYAAFHINAAGLGSGTLTQQKAAVLSAMTVTMTRVNGVYERDMSLRMNLVANNDLIIFVTSDSFSNDNASSLINESQTVIDGTIGSANYDIGHTVSTGGGGLAQRPSVCVAGKARGITGSPSPVGDPYDIDYVAHEVGHQFGGSHTFNGVGGNCSSGPTGTRSASTAVEPGSGSTIMAYAGICTGINVQGNSDAYFHAVSIGEMVSHITGAGNCVTGTANGNSAPVVNAGADYTIPKGTPFMLTGTATDANGDTLTYCWEQTNTGTSTATATPTSTTGPNFRSFNPTTSPTRYFPSMPLVLNGNLTSNWEVLSNVARTMNFALTVRDNRTPNGGQTQRDNMNVTIDATRGPLTVTSQNTDGIVWAPGSTQTITWAVNSTNASAGGSNVTILLSTDNGVTFPTVLLASTANNGSASITVPNVTAANCRVMVKAAANIFFNVNLKNIAIGNYTYQNQNVCTDYPFNLNAAITESTGGYPGYNLPITDSYTITAIKYRANITHPNIGQVNVLLAQPWEDISGGLITALWYNNTTCNVANLNKWFNTSGITVDCAQTTNATEFRPYSITNINAAVGQNSAGNWGVYFKDGVVDGQAGTFNTFTIQLCRAQLVPVLATSNFGLENFSIYPNPNNGNFTVQFDSNSGNNVKVGVHDMRGRLVFEKDYQNTGTFNQNVQLNNVQSGIYLVTVQDGERKEVKKIVIN